MNLGVVFGTVPRYKIYLQFYIFFICDCMQCSFAACEPVVLDFQQLSGHKQSKTTKLHRNSKPTMEILWDPANG